MIFQDSVLKAYLRNVYFLSGTPCGGKTTVSRALGRRHGIPVYDVDEVFPMHRLMSDRVHQPSMNQTFRDADAFFSRSVEEYRDWLIHNTREQLDFVLMDLIRLSQSGRILCDCHLTVEEAERITEPSRIAFLIRKPDRLVEEYCRRNDHQGFNDFIHSATDVEAAKARCNETLRTLNEPRCRAIRQSGLFFLERESGRSVAETVRLVEAHFGWQTQEDLRIVRVERGTEMAGELLRFVEGCSWLEAREHIAWLLRTWAFTDWEAMFVALKGSRIAGMTSVMKADYYPLPEIYPWISSVFVAEEFRGQRLSERLIAHANRYVRELGFARSYIPSEHVGLYERYGYHYLREIRNDGGGVDHLYAKELT